MSRINGEKARAAVAKRNRTARRAKDRERLAEIRTAAATTAREKKALKSEPAHREA